MFVDTHCHINMMVKKEFDVPLQPEQLVHAQQIVEEAKKSDVTTILNVGTSLVESKNSILLAQQFPAVYASVGIHPNDCTPSWREDLATLTKLVKQKEVHRIVAIGECGMDFHYPDYDKQRQRDAFKAQIEMALEHNLGLVVHTRQAPEETLRVLEEFAGQARGVIHCFSEDLTFAQQVIAWNLFIGIGGTITYPKNNMLRAVVASVELANMVLETDAPFLPIQRMRGQQNHPLYIKEIATYIAQLRGEALEEVARQTTQNAFALMGRTPSK